MGCVLRLVALVLLLALLFVLLRMLLYPPSAASQAAPAALVAVSTPAVVASGPRVVGRPSLSAAFIDRVLAAYHSPAVGLGQAMYQDSLHFGIDDAFALAFFLHESGFGRTGVAAVTHSVGNIICTPGWASCVGRFRWYPSWAAGCWDWFRLLAVEYLPRGLSTVETIVPVYAPASDHNDVAAYIAAVVSAVLAWRAGRVFV